jgi:uncharacterized protein YcfJ
MKCISLVAMSAVLLIGSQNAAAQSQDDIDVLLGAAAGAAIGSTIGDGDGRKVATVLGGLIGANMARNRHEERHGYRYVGQRFESICKDRVPAQYRNNIGVARSWVQGCVARLEQRQAELEQQAFEEALNGPSN